mmetsp:Transcript_8553/g.20914  ORF Transcript_8553/g.20914 Transcript_8553/m.20914 type:complete len:222 (-) Transcript_8553:1023-1688(-)
MAQNRLGLLRLLLLLPTLLRGRIARLFCLRTRSVTQRHPPCLEVARIGTRANLPVLFCGWQPSLQIITKLGTEPYVTRAQSQFPVRNLQFLQALLGVTCKFVVLFVRRFRSGDLHHLNLVELVRADKSSCVTTVAPRLRSEAGRQCTIAQRQIRLLQDLVRVHICQRYLGRGDQEGILSIARVGFWHDFEQILLEFGQLRRPLQRGARDHQRRGHFDVTLL